MSSCKVCLFFALEVDCVVLASEAVDGADPD